uniref:Uncharacterized protein n=1 Tax=Myripristis murdjan TaxID=586833 RepID=A0A667XA62_9TELE
MASVSSLSLHLLCILTLLFLITFCPQGILTACKRGENDISTSFVPGHSFLGQGFDLVRMQHSASLVFDTQTHTNTCMLCQNTLMGNEYQKWPSIMSFWGAENSQCTFSSSLYLSVGSLVEGVMSPVVDNAWRKDLGLEGSSSQQLVGSRSTVASYALAWARSDQSLFTLHQLSCSEFE